MTGGADAGRPQTVVTTELLDPGPVAALAALFDDGLPAPAPGDPLPPLWHWVALPRWSPSSHLHVDGHPVRGSMLPSAGLPRRMFAGGAVEFPGTLRVGEEVRREASVESVTEKTGRSGRLAIVVTATTLSTLDGAVALVEKQHLVYREAASSGGPAPSPVPAAAMSPVGPPIVPEGPGRWAFRTDPTLLMRFSAVTANAHRIHYDWPYATGVEGYPGLVVQGPLMTLALAECHRLAGGAPVTALAHRTRTPLFCGQSAMVRARSSGDTATMELFDSDADAADAAPGTVLEFTPLMKESP